MEMVDILTVTGKKTGQIKSRAKAHKNGLWHRTVHVWLQNSSGNLLLQKRSHTKETHPGLWDISAAGHVAVGDNSDNAALREVKEELGIVLNNNELRCIGTVLQSYIKSDNSLIDNEITDIYLCKRPVTTEEICIDPVEIDEVAWFDINILKNKLVTEKDLFVPHNEEYEMLFTELSV